MFFWDHELFQKNTVKSKFFFFSFQDRKSIKKIFLLVPSDWYNSAVFFSKWKILNSRYIFLGGFFFQIYNQFVRFINLLHLKNFPSGPKGSHFKMTPKILRAGRGFATQKFSRTGDRIYLKTFFLKFYQRLSLT